MLPLFDRRLIIVTGKGGTGKTTVAAALALAAARRGLRVLVAEVGREEHVPRLLTRDDRPVGYAGRELQTGLWVQRIDPFAALAEYLGLQLGFSGLVERLLRARAFRQLMEAAPGWRELITLGKIWHLEQLEDDSPEASQDLPARHRFDLIVVDAPATGHGLTFLDVPRVVVSAVRAGPLRRHATWVEAMIRDKSRTLVLPVALAEELPTRETLELVDRLQREIGVAVDRVVVNCVLERPFPASLGPVEDWLTGLPEDLALPGLPPARILAACARHLQRRYALNARYLEQIESQSRLPVVPLPRLPGGIRSPEDLSSVADALEREPRGARH